MTNMQKLDEELLNEYMNCFFGYGNLNSDYWFIGMEESGGTTFNEIEQRLVTWEKRGMSTVEDLYDYHIDINVPEWFTDHAQVQKTWNGIIRIFLRSDKGIEPNIEDVRKYQINDLARSNGETCIIELLPLPSPSISDWKYNRYSSNPLLVNRNIYTQKVGAERINKITSLINDHNPKNIIFFGIGYLKSWCQILQTELDCVTIQNKSAYFGKVGNANVAVTHHPSAHGMTTAYYHEVGEKLANMNYN